jgi:tetratricopeptide (TPR) repeat protein
VLDQAGRGEEATRQYDQVSSLTGDDPAMRRALGQRLLAGGRAGAALEQFQRILRAQPNNPVALYGASLALDKLGRGPEAVECLARAVELAPGPQSHLELGNMLTRQGNSAEAIRHFRLALRLKPDWAPASASLAWELATARDEALRSLAEAVSLAEAACKQTNYGDPAFMDILAAALAASGQFDRAVVTAQKALGLAPTPDRAHAIQSHLDQYKAHKPSARM